MKPQVAQRRIQAFRDRFGEAHFALATHAAFPLALTSELLYQLWANFQQSVNGEVLNIPWIAVADILLSGLCEEVGDELYEMPKEVRDALLAAIKDDSRFGQKRLSELSKFVLNYVKNQLNAYESEKRDFAQAQRWTALAYTEPTKAAHEIALTLSNLSFKERLEWLRLESIVETLSEPLLQFEPLLIYVRGITKSLQGNNREALEEIQKLKIENGCLKILGISLKIPDEICHDDEIEPRKQRIQKRQKILQKQAWQCSYTLEHLDSVLSVAFSHDDKAIVSAGECRTISIWDSSSGDRISTLLGHEDTIHSVVTSSDNRIIASGSSDRTVKIWNRSNGELLKTLNGHSDSVYSLSISLDGQLLASGSADETTRIWNIESGQCLFVFRGHKSWVRSVMFSPNSQLLISGGDDEKIIVWDLLQGSSSQVLSGHSSWVRSLAVSSDGQILISGGNDFKVQIWNLPDGNISRTITEFISDQIYTVAISHDKQFVVGGGRDKKVGIWSLSTWELPYRLSGRSDEINSVAISSDGKKIISGSSDSTVKVWANTS